MATQSANAIVIYDISADTSFGDNAVNAGTGATFTDNADGTFDLSAASDAGVNTAVFVDSSDGGSVSTILGRALTSLDVVTVSVVVDFSDINLNSDGIEYGLQSAAGFRTIGNYLLQIDDGGNRGGLAPQFFVDGTARGTANSSDTPGAAESSLRNGFTAISVYDSSGITFTVSDIVPNGFRDSDTFDASSYTFFYTDADYTSNFTTAVGNSFAYFSTQRTNGGFDTTISEFSIDVTSVPEPTSALFIALASGLMLRRRR